MILKVNLHQKLFQVLNRVTTNRTQNVKRWIYKRCLHVVSSNNVQTQHNLLYTSLHRNKTTLI
jgi:hypothetical protein